MSAPKRFVVFAGDSYYPAGGWGDLEGSYDTEADAREAGLKLERRGQWWHAIDLTTGEQVDGG